MTTKTRRVRCDGQCGNLYDPDRLRPVGMKRRLCEECILVEAAELAGVEAVRLPDRAAKLDVLPDVECAEWPGRRGRLSPSEIGTFLACPEQWRMERILGWKSPSSSRMIVGHAVHAVAETYWEHRLAGETLDDKTIRVTAGAAFDDAVSTEVDRFGSTIDWREPHDLAREEAAHLASVYLADVGEWVEPVSTEATTIVRVAGVPIPIVSIADLVRGEQGVPAAIVDLKCGSKAHTNAGEYWTVQGLVQQLGQDLPCEWHSVGWNGQVNTPRNAPGLRVERTAERYVIAAELVRRTYQTILLYHREFGPFNVWPGARSTPRTCDMCDHTADCSWWTGESWLRAGDLGVVL